MSEDLKLKKLINSTLSSLELINKLNKLEVLDDRNQAILTANIKHIELMLANTNFKKACTRTQLKKFNDIIKN